MPDALQEKLVGRLRYLLTDDGLMQEGNPLADGVVSRGARAATAFEQKERRNAAIQQRGIAPDLAARKAQIEAEGVVSARPAFRDAAIAGYNGEDVIPPPNGVLESGTSGAVSGLVSGGGLGSVISGFMDGVRSAVTNWVMEIPFVGSMIRTVGKLAQNLFNGKGFDWAKASEEAEAEHKAGKMVDGLIKSGAIEESQRGQMVALLLDESAKTMTEDEFKEAIKATPAVVAVTPAPAPAEPAPTTPPPAPTPAPAPAPAEPAPTTPPPAPTPAEPAPTTPPPAPTPAPAPAPAPAPTASANPTPAPAAETPPPPPLPTTTTPTQAAPPAEAAPPATPASPTTPTPPAASNTPPPAPTKPEECTTNIGEDGQCSTRTPSVEKIADLGTKFRNGEYDRIPVNGAGAGGVGAVGAPLTTRDISVV